MNYILIGNIGRRGFSLEESGRRIFQTKHPFGILPNSSVKFGNDDIRIKLQNFLGIKSTIYKNGHQIGNIDFTTYLYSTITLETKSGSKDIFKVEEEGFSQTYILSQSGRPILKLSASLNPLDLVDIFKIEILSDVYPHEVIEELALYAGEVLFRLVRTNSSRLM